MNVNEAREKFPIGSQVVITNPGGNYSTFEWWAGHFLKDYEDFLNWKLGDHSPEEGDVGTVLVVEPHGGFRDCDAIVAIRVEAKQIFLMNADSLVPYPQPCVESDDQLEETKDEKSPFEPVDEDKRFVASFNGTNLVVSAYGETVTRNVEELLDELRHECWERAQEPKVGDKIVITDSEMCYSANVEWLKEHATPEQMIQFDWANEPPCGKEGEVVAKAPHNTDPEKTIYLVEIVYAFVRRSYLMDGLGIKKA